MISFNWSLNVTVCRDYSFFDSFKPSGWMVSKKVCLSCICTEGFAVQVMALCPSSLQYRHRLCCIQRVFSATDSGSQRQGWATERFIESSPVAGTEAHWVIVRGVAEVVIAEPHVRVTWGVTGDVLVVKAQFCGVITWAWVLLQVTCWTAQWQLSMICRVWVKPSRFRVVMFTVIKSWQSSSEIPASSADFLAFSFHLVYSTWQLNSVR